MRKVMVSAAVVLVAASACSSGSSGGSSAAAGPDLSKESCTTIIPDVENVSKSDNVQIIDVSSPTMVADHRKEYAAGTYHPNNKPQVEVLTCKGRASLS